MLYKQSTFLGTKSVREQKMVGNKKCSGRKIVWKQEWNKKCSYKILDKLKLIKAKCYLFVTNYVIELPFVALYGSMWPCMIFCGRVCVALLSFIAFSWSCMALVSMDLYGVFMVVHSKISILWTRIVFSRGHRSKFI